MMRLSSILLVAVLLPRIAVAGGADSSPVAATNGTFLPAPSHNPYARLFAAGDVKEATFVAVTPQSPAPTLQPIEYSHAYKTRLKIHKIASVATLPLFATELVLGQSLYDGDGGSGQKSAHGAVGAAIGALFAVNTVTGVWNLWEGRKDPNGRTRRVVHSVLMLAADAGFVLTAALAPESEHGNFTDDRGAHRAAAIASIGLGTAGYLLMLFGK